MSNDNLIERGIWVSDLDGFVYADDFKTKNEPAEILNSGDIALFNGKAVSANLLEEKGIDTLQWRWAMHQAKRRLPYFGSSQEIEQDLVRALILLCRPYAIARYAKWERVDFPSALTASLPLGLKALLSQYLSGQGLNKRQQFNGPIRDALMAAARALCKPLSMKSREKPLIITVPVRLTEKQPARCFRWRGCIFLSPRST